MTRYILTTPREADVLIGRMFASNNTCLVSVREEKAFKENGWLKLGHIDLDGGSHSPDHKVAAVRRGGFEWRLPAFDQVRTNLTALLGDKSSDTKLRRALDAIAAISVRTGLQHPKFDPHALETMPFRRSTTVVADTCAAVQGGLDFVARHLHPAARVKVPAIVQMEIVNFADRFLSGRRASRTRHADLLIDHLMSQGGQRVLLRLELHADTEIERTFLLGDPLRSAFQADTDLDVRDLNLNVSIRAYADRLILEATRQHQALSNLGHLVQLLTSDQGLARMALAEGIMPLFFNSVVASDLFGKRLTGTTLDPFSGSLRETPMTSLLWELATAFGSAKLEREDEAHVLVVSAIGEGLSWSPYHSQADLLWCDLDSVPEWPERAKKQPAAPMARSVREGADSHIQESTARTGTVALQRFSVGQLLGLVDALDNDQVLSEDSVLEHVGLRNRDSVGDYRRFLQTAGLIKVDRDKWAATDYGRQLAVALRNENILQIRDLFLRSPSFSLFAQQLRDLSIGQQWSPGNFRRVEANYRILGEVCGLGALITGEGFYSTLSTPDIEEFAPIALARFKELDQGDGLVATGAWLELLIRKDGIHPEVARNRLNDASAMGLLRRSTEGSTTEVRFDNHVIHVLRIQSGRPIVAKVHLYRGDYLIPGKSSTSLRIEGRAR